MNALLQSPLPDTQPKDKPRAKKKILLVDDDPAIRKMLGILLTGEGYQVLLAINGSESIQVVRAAEIDLVLLDLNMPGMDGWEAFERLAVGKSDAADHRDYGPPQPEFYGHGRGHRGLARKTARFAKTFPHHPRPFRRTGRNPAGPRGGAACGVPLCPAHDDRSRLTSGLEGQEPVPADHAANPDNK